ncbi:MAG: hypothetical protein IT518_28955 [Burkholderiales bacterium]|nr:hypothetical protein [Burkholderiales bacterium]
MAWFEVGDDLVRQTVLFVDRQLAPGQFGDVMDLVRGAQSQDPEHEAWAGALRVVHARLPRLVRGRRRGAPVWRG